tara:strand:- start:262 stop:894 length:633 start_codon:yes stop_codon:yes gene_type:complete
MLIKFIISCFFLAVSPGPDNIYTLSLTMESGRKSGVMFILGLVFGCLVHTLLLTLGFSILILESSYAFNMLKYFGFIYLIYLAIQVYFSKNNYNLNSKISNSNFNSFSYIKRGFLMNLLNPKVLIFFIAFFPNFIFSETIPYKFQILCLGLIFILITVLVFGSIVIFSSNIYLKFKNIYKYKLAIRYFNVIILIAISLLILFSENNITLD